MAKWDPLTRPVVAEVSGKAKFVDIEDGITARVKQDELTGLSNIEIIDITEATPIIIPKAVKKVLSLCDIKLRIAILNKSRISMEFLLRPDLE